MFITYIKYHHLIYIRNWLLLLLLLLLMCIDTEHDYLDESHYCYGEKIMIISVIKSID